MDQLSRLTGMSSPNDRGKRNDSKQLSFHLKLMYPLTGLHDFHTSDTKKFHDPVATFLFIKINVNS